MEEIRSEFTVETAVEPLTGMEHHTAASEVRHVLADTGGIQSHQAKRQAACFCGCLQPPGGFCSVCGNLICSKCFVHCAICSRPLGPKCSHFRKLPGLQSVPLCTPCFEEDRRKRRLVRVSMFMLSPFVCFKKEPPRTDYTA